MSPRLLIPILVALAACRPTLAGAPWAARYQDGGGYALFRSACRPVPAHRPSLEALAVLCSEAWAERNAMFHLKPVPAEVEPARAAALVAMCAATVCDPASDDYEDPFLALAWDLATRTEPDAVVAALAAGELAPYIQRDFVARYRAARARVLELVAARGEHWHAVMIRPVLDARARRAAADQALAGWLARVDRLAALADRDAVTDRDAVIGSPAAHWVVEALTLRRAYVAACRPHRGEVDACLADAVGLRLGALIDRLAAAAGDQALITAEAVVRALPRRDDPRTDEWLAADAAMTAERARHAEYAKARGGGTTEAALAARWPTPPLALASSPSRPYAPRFGIAPVPRAYQPGRAEIVEDVIASITRKGTRAVIHFRRNVHTRVEGTGCRETNRVHSIAANGEIIYRTICTGPDRKVTEDRTTRPVEVPWAEAATLARGDKVRVAIDSARTGYVVGDTFLDRTPAK